MGLLLAVFRRLSLRKRIDQGQFKLMQISDFHQRIQKQLGDAQRAKTQAENAMQSYFTNAANGFGLSIQNQLSPFYNNYMRAQQAYFNEKSKTKPNEKAVEAAYIAMENAKMQGQQAQNTANMANSIFSQQLAYCKSQAEYQSQISDGTTLERLHQLDTAISQEKELLEQQLKLLEAEYESVGKLADKEAKETAPKFGLS